MLSDFVFYNCGVLAAQLLRSQTKNSPQDCFLNAQTLSGSSPYRKREPHFCDSFLLSMGYEKDIFGSFAYDFELSQKLIFG